MRAYRIFRQSTREPVETVEAHVLAKAYRSVWRSIYASEPVARHVLERLGLVIDFGGTRFASSVRPIREQSADPALPSSEEAD